MWFRVIPTYLDANLPSDRNVVYYYFNVSVESFAEVFETSCFYLFHGSVCFLKKIVQKPFPSFRPPPEGNIEAPSSHTSPVPHSRHLLIKHREEHCFEFSSPKFCSYPTQLLYVEDVRDLLQMLFIDLFRLKKTQTRGHVEFINSALKYLKEYGLHKDLDTYKAILNVFPKGAMIPRNTFQVGDFHHFFFKPIPPFSSFPF